MFFNTSFFKRSAIHQYLNKLPQALRQRYGGVGPYTQGQIETTVSELRLNRRFIQYAYLLYAGKEPLFDIGVDRKEVDQMSAYLDKLIVGGFVAGLMASAAGGGDAHDGGADLGFYEKGF